MTFGEIIYTILIKPLQLFFEVVFMIVNNKVNYPGISIIALSLIMNILVLPLYMRADAIQEGERLLEAKIHKGVVHIKKTFRGDERMMMLQTYYRQNGYKPTDVFKESVSLFLEIPFFVAAYQFLSNLELLEGSSFGPICDLGAPDALIHIGVVSLNVLPIIMTAVNLLSCVIFTKDHPARTKIQLYGMAIFFLVFLYDSPAGLVFYWTLNNLFSLVKTIFYKLKNPKRVLMVITLCVGVMIVFFLTEYRRYFGIISTLFILTVAIMCMMPTIIWIIKKKYPLLQLTKGDRQANKKVYLAGIGCMTILMGIVIPSSVLVTSPQEFIVGQNYLNPSWYIMSALCISIGFFVMWCSMFYWLAGDKYQPFFDFGVWLLVVISMVNYFCFGKQLSTLNSNLQYINGLAFLKKEVLLNMLVLLLIALAVCVTYKKIRLFVPRVLAVTILALGIISAKNIIGINSNISSIDADVLFCKQNEFDFELSKNGKNVVVLMLDRAMGEYVPYIINEKPELKDKFAGFTYYPNTISFGGYTNTGSPALYGGYEYTPFEMNKRGEESLQEKHNEALKVMPVIFAENGYDVTVCAPTYANYQWIPDIGIFDEYPKIDAYVSMDSSDKEETKNIAQWKRNFFFYSAMKGMPLLLQKYVYNNGQYYDNSSESQQILDVYHAQGLPSFSMKNYYALQKLSEKTKIVEKEKNTFLIMSNDITHDTMMLQEPEYIPARYVNNTEYEQNTNRFVINGIELHMNTPEQYCHYQCNMVAMLLIADWLEYLKQNDVYDNTRIIIVSDHGRGLNHIEEFDLGASEDEMLDTEYYYPLLMIKDFNSKKFSFSDDFMTNADVPTYALNDVIDDARNPFTGKRINNSKKNGEQFILASNEYSTETNNGNQFLAARWLSVSKNRLDKKNWKILGFGQLPKNEN